jgi:PIN domain nuclease of toxin-antitoxin system
MRLLVDTHALLWFRQGSSELSDVSKQTIEDPANDVFVSAATLWEIAIKVSLGKLDLPAPYGEYVARLLDESAFAVIGAEAAHFAVVSSLVFHHRDPFDRLLAAQCLVEQMPIVSADATFDAYGVQRIW